MLLTRIIGDPQYQAEPLKATFDLTVVSPLQTALSDRCAQAAILLFQQ